jgi:hypothetical protein
MDWFCVFAMPPKQIVLTCVCVCVCVCHLSHSQFRGGPTVAPPDNQGLNCNDWTREICTQIDDACCPPCNEAAALYMECIVSVQLVDICPGATCLEGSPNMEDDDVPNNSTNTTTTTNSTTSTTEEDIQEVEERAAPEAIDVDSEKEAESDAGTYTGEKPSPVSATEKVPVKLDQGTPDAEAIRTSNAYCYRYYYNHVSSMAMFGILWMAWGWS